MNMRFHCLMLAVGLSAFACEKDSKATLNPDDFPKNVGDPAIIVMADNAPAAGKTRARPLRLKPAMGAKQSISMALKMEMGGAAAMVGDIGMTMDMDAEVVKVEKNGNFHTEVMFRKMDIDNPQMANLGISDMLAGMKVKQVVSERGFIESGSIELPPSLQMLKPMFDDSMKQMAFALPEGGVGVGSSWTTRETLEKNGIRIYQEIDFKVTSLKGNQAELSMKLKQRALEQTLDMMGAQAEVKKLESTGTGTVTLVSDKPIPVAVHMSMELSTEMSVAGQDIDQDMKMTMKMTSR